MSCNIDVCSAETLLSAELYCEYMGPLGWYIFFIFLGYCSMCWCSVAYKLLWPFSPECLDSSSTLHSYTLWWNNQFSSKYYKRTSHSPSIGIRYPDSKVRGANTGAHLGPTGPRRAPCWPHEPCYQGMAMALLVQGLSLFSTYGYG